jgi:hypothetical protein
MMGFEEEQVGERIDIIVDKNVLLQALIIGLFSFCLTGLLIYNLASCVITFGLSMVIGSTLTFLGIYFLLVSKPLFHASSQVCIKEEDEGDIEFQSTMKLT